MKRYIFALLVICILITTVACIQQLDDQQLEKEYQDKVAADAAKQVQEATPSQVPETTPEETQTPQEITAPEEPQVTVPEQPQETPVQNTTQAEETEEVIAPPQDTTSLTGEDEAKQVIEKYLSKRKAGDVATLYTFYAYNNTKYNEYHPTVQDAINTKVIGSYNRYKLVDYNILTSQKLTDEEFKQYYIKYTFDVFGRNFLGKELYLVRADVVTDPINVSEKLNKYFDQNQIGIAHFFLVREGTQLKIIYTDTRIDFHQIV